jgi:hypothetical protein
VLEFLYRGNAMKTDEELRRLILTKMAVPLWPETGRALGLSRGASYSAARAGDIATIDIGRRKLVATAWLRKKLHIEQKE